VHTRTPAKAAAQEDDGKWGEVVKISGAKIE
jgi:hypothetical protein